MKKLIITIAFSLINIISVYSTVLKKSLRKSEKEIHLQKKIINNHLKYCYNYLTLFKDFNMLILIVKIKQLENPCRGNVAKAIDMLPLSNIDKIILKKQLFLESGKFKSELFINYNNLSGMKIAGNRMQLHVGRTKNNYAIYPHWTDSILDRFLLIKDTKAIILSNYAQDKLYNNKLKWVDIRRYKCYHSGECQ